MAEAKTKPKQLFDRLRTDPSKVSDGVWVVHPDGYEFRLRQMWCAEHARAHLQAVEDLGDEASTEEGARKAEAIGMATGLIVDWRLPEAPEEPYAADKMAAALQDPELAEIRTFIRIHSASRVPFRPDRAAGN